MSKIVSVNIFIFSSLLGLLDLKFTSENHQCKDILDLNGHDISPRSIILNQISIWHPRTLRTYGESFSRAHAASCALVSPPRRAKVCLHFTGLDFAVITPRECRFFSGLLLPENWVNVEPKDTITRKIKRRKDLLFAASKENTRLLSQNSVSQTAKLGKF